mmetsp:Transcript_9670/g.20783  ORF Transcript_9670/g.20783 Transcript_9670/m.20783 type:complete len:114 (-) Transcript_9670:423-764(-)
MYIMVLISKNHSTTLSSVVQEISTLPKASAVLECALARLLDGMTGMSMHCLSAPRHLTIGSGNKTSTHPTVIVGGVRVGGRVIRDDGCLGFSRARRPVTTKPTSRPGGLRTAL